MSNKQRHLSAYAHGMWNRRADTNNSSAWMAAKRADAFTRCIRQMTVFAICIRLTIIRI